jgi:hypothetical protein
MRTWAGSLNFCSVDELLSLSIIGEGGCSDSVMMTGGQQSDGVLRHQISVGIIQQTIYLIELLFIGILANFERRK